jgi:hypothetical protein
MKLQVLNHRNPCGECTACCEIMGIEELHKEPYTRCPHQAVGCTIYSDRPAECRRFLCLYAAGLMGDSATRRPDRNGLMFNLSSQTDVQVWEVVPGAFKDSARLDYLISKISAQITVDSVALFPHGSNAGMGVISLDRFAPIGPRRVIFKG